MQSVLIMWCFICKVFLLCGALYAKCSYYLVFYMQSVLIIWCFICKVSLLFDVLYAKCPYYLVFYMQSVLIIWCFICKVSLLFGVLYTKCPYYLVFYMQSVLIMQCFPRQAYNHTRGNRPCIARIIISYTENINGQTGDRDTYCFFCTDCEPFLTGSANQKIRAINVRFRGYDCRLGVDMQSVYIV